jgi:hypothetical protein
MTFLSQEVEVAFYDGEDAYQMSARRTPCQMWRPQGLSVEIVTG